MFFTKKNNSQKLRVVKMGGGYSPHSRIAKIKFIASVIAEKIYFLIFIYINI